MGTTFTDQEVIDLVTAGLPKSATDMETDYDGNTISGE
jgi:hypothetical protein